MNTKGFIYSEKAQRFAWVDIIRCIDDRYGITHIQPVDRNFMTIAELGVITEKL